MEKMSPEITKELLEDYEALKEKYAECNQPAFAMALICFCSKTLLDLTPKHGVAHECITTAVEEGINWHVEERSKEWSKWNKRKP